MKVGRVALFTMSRSCTSLAIAVATTSVVTHCAVEVDGVWYDASESRGDFNEMQPQEYADRNCYIIKPVSIPESFLESLEGKRYDFAGVGTWLLARCIGRNIVGVENPYCFEVGYLAMTGGASRKPVSGRDLLALAEDYQLAVSYGRFGKIQ